MSLSEAPIVKITYQTPQDISDEVLGGVIHFCRTTGYKQNLMILTFFWSSFLFSSRRILEENDILNATLNCYIYSLGKVFSKVSEGAELRENLNNMQSHYWQQLTTNFNTLHTETEIASLIKIAEELNKEDTASAVPLKKDPMKSYSHYASNISSNIYCILHDVDNGICIQYKYFLDEFRFQKSDGNRKQLSQNLRKKVPVTMPSSENTANDYHLGMAWYKFLIYFALIAGAIVNLIYSFNYIFGSIYAVESNGTVSAEQIYAYYGMGLQVVDIIYGLFLIAFAVLAFVVRHKLVNYEPDSLKFIKILYSLSAGTPFLYAILVAVITGQSLAMQAIGSTIVGFVFLALNVKYFKKRAHMFNGKIVSEHTFIQAQSVHKTYENLIASKPKVSKNQTIMFCRKCGTKLHEGSAFCHKCGTNTVFYRLKEENASEQVQVNPVEKLALLTIILPSFVAESSEEESSFVKNNYTYCDAVIFAEFFIRANALELAPSREVAIKFSDEYLTAVIFNTIELIPEAESFFVDMFFSRVSLYDDIVLNSQKPTYEVVEILSHIIHKEADENKFVEVKDKIFRYYGGIFENLTIQTELVSLFECLHSCTKEAMDELKEYLKTI